VRLVKGFHPPEGAGGGKKEEKKNEVSDAALLLQKLAPLVGCVYCEDNQQ
jgi:hypothetical protein